MYVTEYNGEHSVVFGNKDSWKDWHLIPSSRPVFATPEVKTNFIDIPGADGGIDLSEALSGYPVYKNRNGSFKFLVDPNHMSWNVKLAEITEYLHGKTLRAILSDEPSYFYEGRFWVSSWESGSNISSVTIGYDVEPYKRNVVGTLDEWIWDTFNFETGVIQNYKLVDVNGSLTLTIIGDAQRVSPIFTSTADMTITYNGSTYPIKKGTSKIYGVTFGNGNNIVTINGTGRISIDYRRGRL